MHNVSNHVVKVAFDDRGPAFALAAELRRRAQQTYHLEVNRERDAWIVTVPSVLWRSPVIVELVERYGGKLLA